MRIVAFAGKSGSGKTEAMLILTGVLADLGYTVKVESFALSLRKRACEQFGDATKEEARAWMQKTADNWLETNPNILITDLIRRNNMDTKDWEHFSDCLDSADFLVIHDVRRENEVKFCRKHGVVVFLQGTHRPLPGDCAAHNSEIQVVDLFHGADYIIPKQPTIRFLTAAIKAMVDTGGHLKAD